MYNNVVSRHIKQGWLSQPSQTGSSTLELAYYIAIFTARKTHTVLQVHPSSPSSPLSSASSFLLSPEGQAACSVQDPLTGQRADPQNPSGQSGSHSPVSLN